MTMIGNAERGRLETSMGVAVGGRMVEGMIADEIGRVKEKGSERETQMANEIARETEMLQS